MRGARTAKRVLAWARRRRRRETEPHGLVLMYHRVARVDVDPWALAVSPRNFESQIRALREQAEVVPVADLYDRLRMGRDSKPVVAITFDDAYLDNLEVAKPVLQRFDVPATVFVPTGYVGAKEPFWWDRLAAAVLGRVARSPSVRLESAAGKFTWDDVALVEAGRGGARARRRLHDALWHWMHELGEHGREDALAALEAWGGGKAPVDRAARAMRAEELRSLAAGGLVEIGAHSVSHPLLTRLPSPRKAEEIRGSRQRCAELLGCAPRAFAFPNGDFDEECVSLVRDAGFSVACTSRSDLAWAGDDRYRAPRVSVPDLSGDTLLRRLRLEWWP